MEGGISHWGQTLGDGGDGSVDSLAVVWRQALLPPRMRKMSKKLHRLLVYEERGRRNSPQMTSILAKEEPKLPLENDWGRVWGRIEKKWVSDKQLLKKMHHVIFQMWVKEELMGWWSSTEKKATFDSRLQMWIFVNNRIDAQNFSALFLNSKFLKKVYASRIGLLGSPAKVMQGPMAVMKTTDPHRGCSWILWEASWDFRLSLTVSSKIHTSTPWTLPYIITLRNG